MRKFLIAGLIATQALTPAAASRLGPQAAPGAQEAGVFAGARVRLPLGGPERHQRVSAGFVAAPMLMIDRADGSRGSRIGEGLEFGAPGSARPGLSLAGRTIVPGSPSPTGQRAGVSTIGWIAIGVGALAVIVVAAAVICAESAGCIPSE